MAKTFHLRLLLAGQDDLIFEVRKSEADRLQLVLADDASQRFFWFDTLDGRSVIVNLDYLQGVRYLWDVAAGPPDSRVSAKYSLDIALSGRSLLSESPSEDPRDVYTLFGELELGVGKAVTFTDVDGEAFSLITSQIVYVSAPKEVVDEGHRQVEAEDELPES